MSDYAQFMYSEKHGCFHCLTDDRYIEPSYKTICKEISVEQCNEFAEIVASKYPNRIFSGASNAPSFNAIISDFESFLTN